jgi:hypothetical protein
LHRTAWAAAGSGVLFIDMDPNDGVEGITERCQYVFTEWDPTATSDMEALRSVFDSNGDGLLASLSTSKLIAQNTILTQNL